MWYTCASNEVNLSFYFLETWNEYTSVHGATMCFLKCDTNFTLGKNRYRCTVNHQLINDTRARLIITFGRLNSLNIYEALNITFWPKIGTDGDAKFASHKARTIQLRVPVFPLSSLKCLLKSKDYLHNNCRKRFQANTIICCMGTNKVILFRSEKHIILCTRICCFEWSILPLIYWTPMSIPKFVLACVG